MGQLNRIPHAKPLLQLIYFRPPATSCTDFDGKLCDLVARYRDRVRLVIEHTDEGGGWNGEWVSDRCPTVLMMIGRRIVAQLVGDLPATELDRMLRAALLSVRAGRARLRG